MSFHGEQDAEGLNIAVGADLVDVVSKMSCFMQAVVRDVPHVLEDRRCVNVTQRLEELTDGAAPRPALVEAPAAAQLSH